MENLFTRSSAVFSECGRYRYRLTRVWDESKPFVCFVLLNPSTADANKDDPTIRRCVDFAKTWGYGGLHVVNLYAWRATDPAELRKVGRPCGAFNNQHIYDACKESELVVVGWGKVHKSLRGRIDWTMQQIDASGKVPMCLGVTGDGQPRHPLFIRKYAELKTWKTVVIGNHFRRTK